MTSGNLNGVPGSIPRSLAVGDNVVTQNQATSTNTYDTFPSHDPTSSLPPRLEQASSLLASLASLQSTSLPALDPSATAFGAESVPHPQPLQDPDTIAHTQDTSNELPTRMAEFGGSAGDNGMAARRSNSVTPTYEGVNYQTLLDNLSPPPPPAAAAATAPSNAGVTAAAIALHGNNSITPQVESERALPPAVGLPPRPPPQENPTIHPNYSTADSIQSFHQLPTQNASAPPFQASPNNYHPNTNLPPIVTPSGAPGTASSGNGLPPPPLATFQQAPQSLMHQQSPSIQNMSQKDDIESPGLKEGDVDDDRPWAPEVQVKYDQFLQDERMYVLEGVWDRFPSGSRLFVGMSIASLLEDRTIADAV